MLFEKKMLTVRAPQHFKSNIFNENIKNKSHIKNNPYTIYSTNKIVIKTIISKKLLKKTFFYQFKILSSKTSTKCGKFLDKS